MADGDGKYIVKGRGFENSVDTMPMVYPRVMLRSGETYYFPEAAKVIRFQEPRPVRPDKVLPNGSILSPMDDPNQDACALLFFGGDATIAIRDLDSCKALRDWCEWRAVAEGRVIV
jgi:hypothetical protein